MRQDLQRIDEKQLIRELEKGEYVVEKILDDDTIDGKLHYLVKFVGNPDPEWLQPQVSFADAIRKFQLARNQRTPDYKIVLVEAFPCNSKDELRAREQHHIDLNKEQCVNRIKAFTGLTKEEYDAVYVRQY